MANQMRPRKSQRSPINETRRLTGTPARSIGTYRSRRPRDERDLGVLPINALVVHSPRTAGRETLLFRRDARPWKSHDGRPSFVVVPHSSRRGVRHDVSRWRPPSPRGPRGQVGPPGGGSAVSQVTSGLRRAGTQVKRIGRKILGTAGQALPSPWATAAAPPPSRRRPRSPRGSSAHTDDDGAPTPGGKSRYGRLDPRRLRPNPYADHPMPPRATSTLNRQLPPLAEAWLVATTPGVLIFHRRSSKIGPSTSVDLTVANVVVSGAPGAHPRQFSSSPETPSIASARSTSPRDNRGSTA